MSDKLPGLLGHLQSKATNEAVYSEFASVPAIDFKATHTVIPSPEYGRRHILELRVGTAFCVFPEDKGEAFIYSQHHAYRQMTAFIYEDVLKDLRGVMQAVGDGKRLDAMKLLSALHRRLTGDE